MRGLRERWLCEYVLQYLTIGVSRYFDLQLPVAVPRSKTESASELQTHLEFIYKERQLEFEHEYRLLPGDGEESGFEHGFDGSLHSKTELKHIISESQSQCKQVQWAEECASPSAEYDESACGPNELVLCLNTSKNCLASDRWELLWMFPRNSELPFSVPEEELEVRFA